ncbi:GNAT family acetyltransferase [Gracilibacillus halophilus YIM-C55.5]|uniref:GNAT family acetyltransferase n=1 Tax=Gracilibacillus halophilus YIM-C55.5 TaxID=1308866 RepID=N4W8U6_9BACI|nr:GNAT family N-acetyltransferase [Gracilibacillus halophilus]ENH95639.1 GNAT family acetyltransferase [Gracilibacillus halophilus YIM-C55.5]
MLIKMATVSDAAIIYNLMMRAFWEYRDETPPSSALEETLTSVSEALKKGEKAILAFEEYKPVGMVRFKYKEEGLYFYRLSVIPEKQGKGIGKKLLTSLEEYANKANLSTILCMVRLTIPKNIQLYSSIGYEVYDEEVVHKPSGININVVSMKKELQAFK